MRPSGRSTATWRNRPWRRHPRRRRWRQREVEGWRRKHRRAFHPSMPKIECSYRQCPPSYPCCFISCLSAVHASRLYYASIDSLSSGFLCTSGPGSHRPRGLPTSTALLPTRHYHRKGHHSQRQHRHRHQPPRQFIEPLKLSLWQVACESSRPSYAA